jgi:hypothetical protein
MMGKKSYFMLPKRNKFNASVNFFKKSNAKFLDNLYNLIRR